MAYTPSPTTPSIPDLPRYVTQELERVSLEINRIDSLLSRLVDALISAGITTLFLWNDSTIIADPGSGFVLGNNVQLPSVTIFAVSAETVTLATPPFNLLDAGDRVVVVNESADVQEIYTLDAPPIFQGTWWEFAVTHVQGGANNPAAGAIISFIWFPVGELLERNI